MLEWHCHSSVPVDSQQKCGRNGDIAEENRRAQRYCRRPLPAQPIAVIAVDTDAPARKVEREVHLRDAEQVAHTHIEGHFEEGRIKRFLVPIAHNRPQK